MKQHSPIKSGDTVRLLRPPPKVFTNERGRTVWMSDVGDPEFELCGDLDAGTDPYNCRPEIASSLRSSR